MEQVKLHNILLRHDSELLLNVILDSDIIDGNVSITTTVDYDIPIQDMVPETFMSPCRQFEEQFEFYSPGYPQPYPNNTECIRLLEGI